jgi:DnaK suppressor protein
VDAGPDLAAERAEAQRMVDAVRAEMEGIIAEQRANPPDDEHDVEGSSVGYERARVSALLADAEARLAEVDAAVERMGALAYGRCEACGGAIGDERLCALATTRRCLSCASESSSPGLGRRGLEPPPRVG